jgi:N-acyl-D-amino-acid deacylase
MAYDLLIKNGTIVDGTGAPPRHGDVAIQGGTIAEVGTVNGSARQMIDASDLIVAPGFIDPHTHYDAQICWDPLLTCSSWHGVTSVIMGNCGVGLAPCAPQARDIATWDLVNVEAIPFDVLSTGIKWEWKTFPEYLDAAARRGSGINLGFLAPLTPFRHFVMGEASMERAATPEETAEIKALLKEAVAAGAFGFTTTAILQHIGYQGRPLACRLASRDEFKAYANALKELGKGAIELALTKVTGILAEDECDFIDMLLAESQRPVTWLSLRKRTDRPGAYEETLRRSEPLVKRGALPQISNLPTRNQLDMRDPFIFSVHPCFKAAFNQPAEVQRKLYSDPEFRNAFRKSLESPKGAFSGNWESVTVQFVTNPAMKPLEGKSVQEIAREHGKDPIDTLFDLALEDNLELLYTMALFEPIPELIGDPRTLLGVSDGGAHVAQICDAGYCTDLLGNWVREKQIMPLEHAIKRITTEPARFFGIKDRGRLAPGLAADITIFDFNTVNSGSRPEWRYDLPGGGRRLVVTAQGIEYTLVNGRILYEHQQHTGALPGKVLRSTV